MNWVAKKNRYGTKIYETSVGETVYQIRYVPFKGWAASRQIGNQCLIPSIRKNKAEAISWCEAH